MTADIFRSSAERVGRMRELLQDPVFAAAIVCLQDERPSPVVARNADAIESVRVQSRLEQHDADVNLLLSLAEPPLIEEQPEEEPTWGVKRQPQPA
jgi:hypothetical protein